MMTHEIDLNYRPESYFLSQTAEEQLLTQVKGDVLRQELRESLHAGEHERVRQLITGETSMPALNKMLERMHPRYMGGNYLPDMEPGEVEIGRIAIDSTTHDVVAAYAKQGRHDIHYRIVDEYEGSLNEPTEAHTLQPMTLSEFAGFFLQAYPVALSVCDNFPDDLEEGLEFVHAESPFYPEFDTVVRQHVIEHYRKLASGG